MRKKIEHHLLRLLAARMAKQADAVELMPKYTLKKFKTLTKSEKFEIDSIWKPICKKIDYRYWEVYKGMFAFSPLIIPDDIYVSKILRTLNPMRKCYCLQNKNMYPILYKELHMPVTLINCIGGVAFDANNNKLENTQILKTLKHRSADNRLILKPSSDSCSGNGVSILDLNNESDCKLKMQQVGPNYVIQEIVHQSKKTKRFNPTSLNTFRINTLNLNGQITVENIMFRHGSYQSIVDNSGAGGICVGFNTNGKAIGNAIDALLNEYEFTPFGEKYSDLEIPELSLISETAVRAHQNFLPMMAHAAWDFALNDKDEPIFIEINLGWPGIMTEQLSSYRPIFGNRVQEVINFAIENQSKMSFTDFIGHWT